MLLYLGINISMLIACLYINNIARYVAFNNNEGFFEIWFIILVVTNVQRTYMHYIYIL